MSEKRNFPELRFPEFKPGWVLEKVGKNFELISGQHLNPDEYVDSLETDHKTPYFTGPSDFTSNPNLLSKWAIKTTKTSVKDDLLFTVKGSGVGTMMVQTFPEVAIGRQLMAFRAIEGSTHFLHHRLQLLKNFFVALASGNMIPGLTREDLLSTKIHSPSLPEQQKIAEFLTTVDKRIEFLQAKKEKLEAYKKGVMQQIFSQKLRFKADDGSDFPDWEEKKLGEVAEIRRGASPRPISDPKWFSESSEIGWVRISDVSASGRVLETTTQYLTPEGVKKSRKVSPGNIIMSICATIGKPVFTGFEVCIHDGFVVFERLELDEEYLYYYLMFIEKIWYRYGQPGTQVNLNTDIVNGEPVPAPSIEEQKKIVKFLTSLDSTIENLNQQINQTQTWKKGLLQKMFV